MSQYGPSGASLLPRLPRPIPIYRPLPRPPISSQRPPRPILIQRPLLRPDLVPKATPAYPNSPAASQTHSALVTHRAEPSREPFEPHRDQVRRDGINLLKSYPPRRSNEAPAPRGPLRSTATLSARTTVHPDQLHPHRTTRNHGHSTQPYTRHHTTTGRSTPPSHPYDSHSNGRSSSEAGRSAPGATEPNTRTLGCRRSSRHSRLPSLTPPQRGIHASSEMRGAGPH